MWGQGWLNGRVNDYREREGVFESIREEIRVIVSYFLGGGKKFLE